MKKIIALGLLSTIMACSPYQKMFLSPANYSVFLENSCDLQLISHLKQIIDTTEYWECNDPSIFLKEVKKDSSCTYYSKELFPPLHKDSAIWLRTIRPVRIGQDELILGNLYTFIPNQDSIFILTRRVKEYTQNEDFESGTYMGFTYYIHDDSTTVIKTGTRKY